MLALNFVGAFDIVTTAIRDSVKAVGQPLLDSIIWRNQEALLLQAALSPAVPLALLSVANGFLVAGNTVTLARSSNAAAFAEAPAEEESTEPAREVPEVVQTPDSVESMPLSSTDETTVVVPDVEKDVPATPDVVEDKTSEVTAPADTTPAKPFKDVEKEPEKPSVEKVGGPTRTPARTSMPAAIRNRRHRMMTSKPLHDDFIRAGGVREQDASSRVCGNSVVVSRRSARDQRTDGRRSRR